MNEPKTNTDGRRENRRRTLKGGRIVCPSSSMTYYCRICDLSPGGARLEIDQWFVFPKLITLEVGRSELIEARYEAEVRWTRGKQIGVEFVKELPLDRAPAQLKVLAEESVLPPDFQAVREALRKALLSDG